MRNILVGNSLSISMFPWRKLFGFSVLPLVSSVSPLLVLPILSRTLGIPGWTSIAIGMSIGMAGSVITNYGWGVVGPSAISQASSDLRPKIYKTSLVMRLILWAASAPILFLIAELLDKNNSDSGAGLMAIAMSAGGLTPVWYFIGTGNALQIALSDTLPRLFAAAAAAVLLSFIPSVALYPLILLGSTLLASLIWGIRLSTGGVDTSKSELFAHVSKSLKLQTPLVVSSLISSAYTSLSVSIVSVASPQAVAAFSAGDRIRAMAKQGTMAIGNGLQGWVSEAVEGTIYNKNRMRSALFFMTIIGFLIFILVTVFLPLSVHVIFGEQFQISIWTALFFGLSLFFTTVTISTSFHVLAPMGRSSLIASATTTGSLIGLPAILLGTRFWGVEGAALGVAIAEAVVFFIEVLVVWRILKLR